MPQRWSVDVVIPTEAAGACLSPAYDFGGGATHMGIANVPGGWAAGLISFQVGKTIDGTFYDLYTEAGTEVQSAANVTAARVYQSLDSVKTYLSQFRFVKVRSGLTGAHNDQGGPLTLTFVFER